MSRKIWIGVVIAPLVGLLAVGVAGFILWRQREAKLQEHFQRAEELYEEGRWFETSRHYQLWLRRNPNDIESLRKYAYACSNIARARKSELAKAATAYNEILRLTPGDREVQLTLLDLYEQIESWGELKYFAEEILLERNPDDLEALCARALACERMGLEHEAVKHYEQLVERGDAPARVYGALARLYGDQGLFGKARELLDNVLAKRPDNVQVRLARARFFARNGEIEAANAELDKALEMAPEDGDVLVACAQSAMAQRDWSRAAALGEGAILHSPGNPDGYLALAHAYERLGDRAKAIEVLSDLDPLLLADDPALYTTLADMQFSANRIEDAVATVEEFAEIHPNRTGVRDYFRGRESLAKGQFEEAASLFGRVNAQMPEFPPAQFYLAVALVRAGQREQAERVLEAYIKKYPDDGNARALLAAEVRPGRSVTEAEAIAEDLMDTPGGNADALTSAAWALFELAGRQGGLDAKAGQIARMFEEAIRRAPGAAPAYRGLAQLYLDTGAPERARAVVSRAGAAGIAESALAATQGAIAIAVGDKEQAARLYEAQRESGRLSANDFILWADVFRAAGNEERAFEILGDGIDQAKGEDRAALLAERLSRYARAGDIERAEADLAAARETDSFKGASRQLNLARIELGRAYLKQGNRQMAAATLADEILESAPGMPEALAFKAELLLRQTPTELDAVRSLLEEALQAAPDYVPALLALSAVASEEANPGEALNLAERALALSPGYPPAQLRAAELRFQARQFGQARQTLDALLAQDPDNAEALGLLARCYAAEGKLEEAERVATRLKAQAPGLPEARAEWWTALETTLMAAQGDWKEAERVLRERIANAPNDLDAHVRLATVLRASGRSKEGREALEAFVERQRDDPEAWLALARFHAVTGDSDGLAKASTALTRALLIEPGNLPALREAARVQAERGRLSEAIALCDRFLALRPGDDAMQYQKALLLWRTGDDLPAALALIESAIDANETPEYLQLRGIIHLNLEDYASAVKDFERVAQAVKPLPAMTELALAEAYLGAGQRREARETLQRAEQKAASGEAVDPERLDALKRAISGPGAGA